MDSPAKIALVTVWFGTWRGWINLHLESCARNPDITWFFLHDQPAPPAHQPPNVRFVSTSLTDLASRFKNLTGRAFSLTTPYKACDLKPLLGPLFPELVADFEWWGYCDTDLLWGNLRRYLTNDELARHDIITSHVCAIVGQFTIFRGLDLPRQLVAEIPDIDALFADPKYRGVDELLIDKAACAREALGQLRVSRRMVQVWERPYEPSWETWASELETRRPLAAPTKSVFPLALANGETAGSFTWPPARRRYFSTSLNGNAAGNSFSTLGRSPISRASVSTNRVSISLSAVKTRCEISSCGLVTKSPIASCVR